MWNRRKNSSIYSSTSDASGGGGTVSGTKSPGGSFGKEVNYASDAPFSTNSNVARPFGGFGMGSGSFNAKDAGQNGGAVNLNSGRKFRPHLYGRRGRQEGPQGGGGGFARLGGGATSMGSGVSLKNIFSKGAE